MLIKSPRRVLMPAVFFLLLSGCGSPAATNSGAIETAVAQTVVALPTPTVVTPTPAAVWKDKLNGQWVQTTEYELGSVLRITWVIDLDAGRMIAASSSTEEDNEFPIEFGREEGKTVYLRLYYPFLDEGVGRIEPFRFVTNDLVIWTKEGGEEEVRLERK